jgi:2-dehydro-3-deoxyphosphogluconate aldolase / (4S)-4-hydroxy-2-oxoglutarate aldolase
MAMAGVLTDMHSDRVVAVVRAQKIPNPLGLAEALASSGVRCVELTFTIPDVLQAIGSAVGGSAHIGAGTVLKPEEARAAIAAGASFVVSPALRRNLVEVCKEAGVPIFLGAFTPTEVADAVEAGSDAVKLFPASLGGPRYVKDLKGPYPDVDLIPSGGVNEDNAREFIAAGCPAVYAGSKLCPPHLVEGGDLDEIARRASSFAAALR